MSRSPQQHLLDRAIMRALLDSRSGTLPERMLTDKLAIALEPAPLRSELDEALRHADAEYRVVSVDTTYGMVWSLTDSGRAWAKGQRL